MSRILFVGLLLVCLCGISDIGPARSSQAPSITRGLILPDTSGSPDGREYEAALRGVLVLVRRLGESSPLTDIAVLPWATAADCRRSPVWSVELPQQEVVPEAELQLGESGRLFRLCKEREVEKAKRLRGLHQQEQDARFQKQLEPCLIQFERALQSCRQGRANCTSVSGILRRCSEEPGSTLAIVITDGKQECGPLEGSHLPEGARTLIILVPSRGDDEGGAVAERIESIRRVAPWAMVIPSFRLSDPAFDWTQLLGNGSDHPGVSVTAASLKAKSESFR